MSSLDQAQAVTLRGLVLLVGDLANLVVDSIGPHGKAVMINVHSPKQIVVTKNGLDILEAIRGRQHPLADKILDMIGSHISRFGDGTKRILVMLNHFLRALEKEQPLQPGSDLEVKWRIEILAQIRRFRHCTFSQVLNNLRDHPQVVKKILSWNDLEDILCHIVKGFMSTRFPPASANILSNLLFENFMKPYLETVLESSSEQQQEDPMECIKNCMIEMSRQISKKVMLGINQPVTNSMVLPSGFYLSQNQTTNANNTSSNRNSRFIIWLARLDDIGDNNDDDNTSNVVIKDGTLSEYSGWKFLKWKSETFRKFVLKLKSFRVNLIIKVNGLKDHEKSICQELEMAVIEYVDHEEAEDLASEADILALNGSVYDNLQVVDEKFIGTTTKPLIELRLGRHFYTQLILPEKSFLRFPYVFICGMTQSSAEQYCKAMAQCLRLLASTSLTRSSKCMAAIPETESHPGGAAGVIEITSLFAPDEDNNMRQSMANLDCFEHGLIKALNIQLTSSTEAVKELDVILALRKTLEALVSSGVATTSKYVTSCSRKCLAAPYPLDSAIEQINTMLDITEMLLSIERICSVKRRIKDVITKDCDSDTL